MLTLFLTVLFLCPHQHYRVHKPQPQMSDFTCNVTATQLQIQAHRQNSYTIIVISTNVLLSHQKRVLGVKNSSKIVESVITLSFHSEFSYRHGFLSFPDSISLITTWPA